MSDVLGHAAGSLYAEALEVRRGALERAYAAVARRTGLDGSGARRERRFATAVEHAALEIEALAPEAIAAAAAGIGCELRVHGFRDAPVARAFALARTVASRTLGMRFDTATLIAARAALGSRIAELASAERRSAAAVLAAATAALAGLRVHLLAADGPAARRRFEQTADAYRALGLEPGCVDGGDGLEVRRAAYRCPVVFAGARDVAFDYLRDRLVLHGRPGPLSLEVEALAGRARLDRLLLGGLHCAIVEDADRVLVDAAAAPLAILGAERASGLTDVCRQALGLAGTLVAEADYAPASEDAPLALTAAGERKLEARAAALGGVWKGEERRRLLAATAIAALHALERDRDYVVTGAGVVLSDAATDRAEGATQALQRMLELKEGCEPDDGRRTLARLGTERFFRRYLHLGGFVGSRPGVERPLADGYGLAIARIPGATGTAPAPGEVTFVRDTGEKLALIAERAAVHASVGWSVLVVVANPDAERAIAAALEASGANAGVVVAREAALHALPAPEGPRHVILAELLPMRWMQARALEHARADGAAEMIVALEDPLVAELGGVAVERFARLVEDAGGPVTGPPAERLAALVQRRAERAAAGARAELRKLDDHLGEALAFTGRRF